jgi:putative nucleotidyltransferase with HDIG domain
MPSAVFYKENKQITLESVLRRVHEISTLPHIALRVMEVANSPDSGASDLKQVMESDAALSTRVLRCVNSSAYAVRSRITNLQQAIAYLGLKQIRNLAMTASVSELFKENKSMGTYSRPGLWKHLVSVGVCARLIALRRKVRNFEDVFLAGLLHDVGIILADQNANEQFSQIVSALDQTKTLAENEFAVLGFDHTLLGLEVAESWGFPEIVKASIRYHHCSSIYKGEEQAVVQCVEVANMICTTKGISSVGANLVKFPQSAISGLSLTKEDIAALAADLDREVAQNAGLFQL